MRDAESIVLFGPSIEIATRNADDPTVVPVYSDDWWEMHHLPVDGIKVDTYQTGLITFSIQFLEGTDWYESTYSGDYLITWLAE